MISPASKLLGTFAIATLCLHAAVAQDAEPDQAVASANAAKAVAEAQKAKYEAEEAAAKAKFGALADYAATGGVTASTGAGLLEATLMGSEATRASAEKIAARLCDAVKGCTAPTAPATCTFRTPDPKLKPVFIVGEDEKLSFEAFDAFQLQTQLIEAQFKRALAMKPAAGFAPSGGVTVSTAGFSTALALAGNLLRSDYTVSGVTLTPDNLVLAKEVMRAARCQQIPRAIKLPGQFNPPLDLTQNLALSRFNALDTLRDQANASLEASIQDAKDLQEAAKNEKDKKKAAALLAQSDAYAPIVDALKAAIKRYDDYVTKTGTPDDKGVFPLTAITRQAYLSQALGEGAYLLVLKANFLGGSSYTRKNFFTFFGAMPFSVAGGAVSSFALIEGGTGNVLDSGVFAQSAPYSKVHKTVGRYLNGNP
jgi:hypothetical protein